MNDELLEIEPLEAAELEESMTSEEMMNLIASLKEFDSYSLVG